MGARGGGRAVRSHCAVGTELQFCGTEGVLEMAELAELAELVFAQR